MTKNKYLLIAEEMPKPVETKIIASFEPWIGWWHYLPGIWLIVDHAGNGSTKTMRDHIKNVVGTEIQFFVLEVEPKGWSGMTRSDDFTKKQIKWLNETWLGKPSPPEG